LLRRALDLRAALKLGVTLSLDEIAADEFLGLLILEEELGHWGAGASPETDIAGSS
jgi:hypothetical protein